MAQWLVTYTADPPTFEATRDDDVARAGLRAETSEQYMLAARIVLANVKRRFYDETPVFAADAAHAEAVAFAAMLNEG